MNMIPENEHVELCEYVRRLLIFSHGNSPVEGGFSIKKELLVENQHHESLVAQRIIYDSVKANSFHITIYQKILKSVLRNYCTQEAMGRQEKKLWST